MMRTDLPLARHAHRNRRWPSSAWLARLALVITCAGAAAVGGCAQGSSGIPQCEDGIDNDSDGLTDGEDPACQANPAGRESQDPPHACEDGIDNDADGETDFPDDPNCADAQDQDEFGTHAAQCADDMDNDADGKTDFPDDPGCLVANQNTEADDCPDGPNCPECGNGVDDDFDGMTDFGGPDQGCANAADDSEFDLQPGACGPGVNITVLPPPPVMSVNGMIPQANSQQSGMCGGVGAEVAYVLMVTRPSTLQITTTGTTDTVVYVRRSCSMVATELACNDNNPDVAGAITSKLTVAVQPGSYFIIVDGKGLATSGAFVLNWALYVGRGEECSGPSECAPGDVCRTVPPSTMMTCELPVCSDTRDDDMDGLTDFPADPGCLAPDDSTEADDCPAGPNCPDCANDIDDDMDGRTDFGMDPSCATASSPSEADCPIESPLDPIGVISMQVTNGTTAGAQNNFGSYSCQMTSNAPDRVHMLAVRAPLATLAVDLSNSSFDTILNMRDALCMTSIACDDDSGSPGTQSLITQTNVPVGTYAFIVDGFSAGQGAYTMRVSGTYLANAACDPLSPWFTCPAGNACTGAPGMATCTPAACNDAVDQDGDGFPGFPTDPGCTGPNDGSEADDCPNGPNCPQCGNDLDDDMDGQIDHPLDSGCTSASTSSESCATTDPVRPLLTPFLNAQSTAALVNDFDLSCGADGRDEVYRVRVDHPVDMLRIETIGTAPNNLDTVVAIKSPSCAAADLVCDDNGAGGGASRATLVAPAVGDYFVIVDDKGVAVPAGYNIQVIGKYLDNGRCNPVSPFTCNAGFTCLGAAGAETCTGAACNDNVDADGDGFVGFPSDPGCTDTSDNTEVDTCPAGPGCPQCSDDIDNDMDGLIDYLLDPACTAASTNSELAPCTSMDPVIVFQSNVQGATTMGKANDIDLSCGVDGRDDIYRILVNRPLVSLTVDTFASDTNTAVALRRGTCNGTADLNCGVNNFGTNDARATINNVMPGEYFAIVDDLNTATPTLYNLNVRGVLMGAAACNPASANFVCDTGFNCLGPPGNTVCSPGVCNDAIDGDGDGRNGFPSDPGCSSTSDTDEADDCNLPGGPAGPMCPACANGVDDDNDGQIDYPNDIGCTSANRLSEVDCAAETDPFIQVTVPTHMGTTAGFTNNFNPAACGSTFSPTSPDRVHILTLPVPVATLVLDTENSSFDTTLTFGPPACTPFIECDDDDGVTGANSLITRMNVAAGTYTLIVDGFSSGVGAYNLHVLGTVAAGTACTSPLFAAGVLVCPAGTTCTAGTCQ